MQKHKSYRPRKTTTQQQKWKQNSTKKIWKVYTESTKVKVRCNKTNKKFHRNIHIINEGRIVTLSTKHIAKTKKKINTL